jgi:hypothetical protein
LSAPIAADHDIRAFGDDGSVIEDRIANGDVTLFDNIALTQSEPDDRKSLLAIHDAVARRGPFTYLEIGSYLGGSLQAVVADPRCKHIISIDPRPEAPPDERGGYRPYPYNTTDAMLGNLRAIPGADLAKLETLEASAENIDPCVLDVPDFCFIDGEHTNDAVLRDARFCRDAMRGRGVIAFHDSWLVARGIQRFLREAGTPRRAYPLRAAVFVVELGDGPPLLEEATLTRLLQRPRHAWIASNRYGGDRALWVATRLRRRIQFGRPS